MDPVDIESLQREIRDLREKAADLKWVATNALAEREAAKHHHAVDAAAWGNRELELTNQLEAAEATLGQYRAFLEHYSQHRNLYDAAGCPKLEAYHFREALQGRWKP